MLMTRSNRSQLILKRCWSREDWPKPKESHGSCLNSWKVKSHNSSEVVIISLCRQTLTQRGWSNANTRKFKESTKWWKPWTLKAALDTWISTTVDTVWPIKLMLHPGTEAKKFWRINQAISSNLKKVMPTLLASKTFFQLSQDWWTKRFMEIKRKSSM